MLRGATGHVGDRLTPPDPEASVTALDLLDDDDRQRLRAQQHPDWVTPMKAVLTDDRFSDDGWIYERKLDGIRLLLSKRGDEVRLRSRNRKDLSGAFPELVEALAAQSVDDVVLDGEVVAFDGDVTSFSRLQGRSQLRDPDRARRTGIAVYGYLFDVLHLDGHDLTDVPLRARKQVLRAALDWDDPLRFTAHRNTEGEQFWRDACDKGWEGVIAKRADSPYRSARSKDWLKFKCVAEQEFVVGGFTEPEGQRTGFGALLVGYWTGDGDDRRLVYAGRVGTGYDHDTLRRLRAVLDRIARETPPFAPAEDLPDDAHWVTPRVVAQVGFSEWTHGDRLRHPRFLGVRPDKDAEAVVRERPRPAGSTEDEEA